MFLCPLPFKSVATTIKGDYQICPLSQTYSSIDKLTPLEFFNSSYVDTIRTDMKNGVFSESIKHNCKRCVDDEKSNIKSMRQIYLESSPIPDTNFEEFYIRHVGNRCNLKCITCGPDASSTFGELIDVYDKSKFEFKSLLNTLKTIYIIGGEPLVTNSVKSIFYDISGKDITVDFTTNATVFPKYLNDIDFKDLRITISLDGLYGVDDYVRNFSIFEKKMKNISKFYKLTHNIYFHVTLTICNFKYINDMKKFLKQEFDYNLNSVFRLIVPHYLDPVNIPREFNFDYQNEFFKTDIGNSESFETGISFLKTYDKQYNKNLLDYCLEYKPYYEKAIDNFDGVDVMEKYTNNVPPLVEYEI